MKLDLFKDLKKEYVQTKCPVLVEPSMGQYLSIAGEGSPKSERFQEAVEALYSVAYTIKMSRKKAGLGDYVVCKLEAQWWVEAEKQLCDVCMEEWNWKLLIRTPDLVTEEDLAVAKDALLSKGKVATVARVAMVSIQEKKAVQILHVGAYEDERSTIELLKEYMAEQKVVQQGYFHEIYISDPRRTAPEKLKTILRIPVSMQ